MASTFGTWASTRNILLVSMLAGAVAAAAPPAYAQKTVEDMIDEMSHRKETAAEPIQPGATSPSSSAVALLPTGDYATCWRDENQIGCFTSMNKVFRMRDIPRGGPVVPLPRSGPMAVRYTFGGSTYEPMDFMNRHRVLAMLILKDGQVVQEHYRHGTDSGTRFYSASMAKTVVGLLTGIALEKGVLRSLDDAVERYVTQFAGSAYGKVTIRQLLRMSSGVRMSSFNSQGTGDENRFFQTERGLRPESVMDFLRAVPAGEFTPGSKFRYMSTDSVVLGYVLSAASGKTLSDLFSEWIWQQIGADHDAQWRLMKDGVEYGGGDIFATLHDYGRLALLLANGGSSQGREVVPKKWMVEMTDPDEQPYAFRPGNAAPWFGYGYQTWIFPLRWTTFGMRGGWGQSIFVQPRSGISMVILGALPGGGSRAETDERNALWLGALSSLGGSTW